MERTDWNNGRNEVYEVQIKFMVKLISRDNYIGSPAMSVCYGRRYLPIYFTHDR